MKRKICSAFIAVIMLLCLLQPVFADGNTIIISDRKQFLEFSEKCTLDSWSRGKTVILNSDINMGNSGFQPVPIFSGTFDGKGHTLSEVSFCESGSNIGVFRYIEEGGRVTDLKVKGKISPSGSKSFIGGIAGRNAGSIENCAYEGNVTGDDVIGGIAGINKETGKILSCTVKGSVSGQNFTGGIAGKNEGLISECETNAEVNTVYDERKVNITDINTDAGAVVETLKADKEQNEEESILGNSDAGGIVGYSTGIVQGCVNNGNVGYIHVGYNIGGIAGRQSGYLLGCENHGFIQGRKDVGGIVGQAEPYIVLSTSESNLRDIRSELDALFGMVDKCITDSDNLRTDAKKHLDSIADSSKTARDSAKIMLDEGTNFVNDNLVEVNAESAIISDMLKKLVPVFDELDNGADGIKNSLSELSDTLSELSVDAPDIDWNIDKFKNATDDISSATSELQKAVRDAKSAVDELSTLVQFDKTSRVKSALSDLADSIAAITKAKNGMKTALSEIAEILKTPPTGLSGLSDELTKLSGYTETVISSLESVASALSDMLDSINIIVDNTDINLNAIKYAAKDFDLAMEHMDTAMGYMTTGIQSIGDGISRLFDSIDEMQLYADDVIESLNTAKDGIVNSLKKLSYATDDISGALSDMDDVFTDFANQKEMQFVLLNDNFKEASNSLYNSVSDIFNQIDELSDSVDKNGNLLSGDFRSISSQFNKIMNLFLDEYDELKNKTGEVADVFVDVSDEDIESARQGKISGSRNFGKISGDRNSGGIVGAMAIEYSKDPEDDLKKPDTLNFTYRTKAVVMSCINDGEIVTKKDCSGGIVGLSELGTIYKAENYGDVTSTLGNYVGGIAGKSDFTVRRCYAKCNVEGKRYVGGIAGMGVALNSCGAIVTALGDEGVGAIAGDCENRVRVYKNYFVNNGIGAIDGISYASAAEPMSYAQISEMDVPKRFISFTATFIADGETVKTEDIEYGSDTLRINIPEIPEKKDCFGTWQVIPNGTVTGDIKIECEYKPYITILSSEEYDGKLAVALVEGEFTDKAKLHARDSKKEPPKEAIINEKVIDLSVTNSNIGADDAVTVRFLNKNRDNVRSWILTDNGWEKIKGKKRGSYYIIDITGPKATVCLSFEKKGFNIMIPLAILIFVAGAAFIVIKKRKKTKTK